MKKTLTQIPYLELPDFLGKYAIIEGARFLEDIDDPLSSLSMIQRFAEPSAIFLNVYDEHEQLASLATSDIEAIVIQTTFTRSESIAYLTKYLLSLNTKIKKVFFTFEYGIVEMKMMLKHTDIELFRLADDLDDFELTSYELEDWEFDAFSEYALDS